MTRDEILAMVPGPELDEAVGKVIGATPEIVWYAMNKDETSYSMSFDSKGDAEHWHNNMMAYFSSGRYAKDGGHIVRQEIYQQYSEDISAAWTVFTHFDFQGRVDFCSDEWYCEIMTGFNDAGYGIYSKGTGNTAPLAICKAALLAKEGTIDVG